jgi:ribokinase
MAPKIVVVGSLNMDLVVQVSRIPKPGETVLGNTFHTAAGGKGANQAVAAARLGAQVTMVGCVGDDDYGQALVQGLQADDVDTRFIRRDRKHHTGVALITVGENGENSIVVISGANWHITQSDIDIAANELANADILVLQLETPIEIVEYAASIAHDHHVPIILNPAPARALSSKLLNCITYLVLNESEASLLSGIMVRDLATAELAIASLRRQGVEVVILTMGSQGAYGSDVSGSIAVPAFPVEVIDTTAAGDAFIGGLTFAIGNKQPLEEAVRIAAAAGALATTKAGAQPSLPYAIQVEQLIRSHNTKPITTALLPDSTEVNKNDFHRQI